MANELEDTNIILNNNWASQEPSFNGVEDLDKPSYQTIESHTPDSSVTLSRNCQNRDFAAHETDCNKYYICQHGILLEQR